MQVVYYTFSVLCQAEQDKHFDNLISDTVRYKKTGISWGNGIKTVDDLHRYWTSMAAILASLFSLAECTEYYTEVHLHCFLRKLYSS
jgi:hypothetical protein